MTIQPDPTADLFHPMVGWLAQRDAIRARRGRQRDTVTPSGQAVDLAGNDYLGLARDPRVVAAANLAAQKYGASARASRVVTGTSEAHEQLEQAVAQLTGFASALVYSSGYTANLGAVTSLGGPGCTIAIDAHAHASLQDAARLSRSTVHTFAHNDVDEAHSILAARATPRALVVTESVFSVLGDQAPLVALLEATRATGATLLVDEAHGLGVRGKGAGLVAELGLTPSCADSVDVVVTATFSKALGSQGGVVLGAPCLRQHMVNEARSFIFDTGLAPASAAAAAEAVSIVCSEPDRVDRLHNNAQLVAREIGIDVSSGAVQAVPVGDAARAKRAADALAERNVLVGCFRPPAVPEDLSRLRVTAHATLTVDAVRGACSHIRHVLSQEGL